MPRPKEFGTSDLDLAAAIMTATGELPEAFRQTGQTLITFVFTDDEATRATAIAYATGQLAQTVKRFSACRAWLYRQAKGVR